MKESAIKAQIIMNTLGQLNVPATAENVERLTVIWQLLTQIRDEPAPAPAVRAVPADGSGCGAAERSNRAPVQPVHPEEDKDGKAET